MKISRTRHITKQGIVKKNPPKKYVPERVQVGKEIRKILKKNFPETKFGVKTEVFSGGDSARAVWVDGPTEEQVQKLIKKFQEGNFNGMIDMYEYHQDREGIGVKYVQADRELSHKFQLQASQAAHDFYADLENIKKPITVEDLSNSFEAFGRWNNWYDISYKILRRLDLTNAIKVEADPNFQSGSFFEGFIVRRRK